MKRQTLDHLVALLDLPGSFTRADLKAWLDQLVAYILTADKRGRGGRAMRVMVLNWRAEKVANDVQAELVRRGIRLGLHLASFDRNLYHSAVAKETLRPRKPTVTNEQIKKICTDPKYPTREKQAKRLGIGLRQLYKRLRDFRGK